MNIATICSSNDPWPLHLERWKRYILKGNPGAILHLIWIGDTSVLQRPVFKDFFQIKMYPIDHNNRKFLNSIRMELTELFHVPDMLYVDVDVDVYESLSFIESGDPSLCCIRSTGPRGRWTQHCVDAGWGIPEKEMNNGFLYLKRSYKEEYEKAWNACADAEDRIRGSISFNVLLRDIQWRELDYSTSVIWSDCKNLVGAKSIHYCNDRGQEKRETLERLWRAVQK